MLGKKKEAVKNELGSLKQTSILVTEKGEGGMLYSVGDTGSRLPLPDTPFPRKTFPLCTFTDSLSTLILSPQPPNHSLNTYYVLQQ